MGGAGEPARPRREPSRRTSSGAGCATPGRERARELPEPYLRALDKQQASIDNFAGILTDPAQFVPRLEDALLRLESTWWRGRDSRRRIRFEREQDHLVNLRSRVRVQPGSFTFGSRSGRIPLTLVNDLPQEVVVVLRLEPQTPRLRLDPPLAPQVIGPNRKVQVEVPATAVAGGPVVVEATLHTGERRSPTASRCCCTSTSPRSARWRW